MAGDSWSDKKVETEEHGGGQGDNLIRHWEGCHGDDTRPRGTPVPPARFLRRSSFLSSRSIAPSAARHLSGECPNTIVHSIQDRLRDAPFTMNPLKFWRETNEGEHKPLISFLKEFSININYFDRRNGIINFPTEFENQRLRHQLAHFSRTIFVHRKIPFEDWGSSVSVVGRGRKEEDRTTATPERHYDYYRAKLAMRGWPPLKCTGHMCHDPSGSSCLRQDSVQTVNCIIYRTKLLC